MKKFKAVLFFMFISGLSLYAQNLSTKKADKQFSKFEFIDAAKSYLKIIENKEGNLYVYKQLAESYYNIFNTIEAERWYAKAIKQSEVNNTELFYKYAQMLKANKKYKAFIEQMERFSALKPLDNRAVAFKNNPNYLTKLLEQDSKFSIKNVAFNSPQSDFGGTSKNGKIYFVSGRNTNANKNYSWNKQPFLDLYTTFKNKDGSFQSAQPLSSKINSKYHEGGISFSPDGETMFFSRESFFNKDFEKDPTTNTRYSQLYLYKATLQNEEWGSIESLSLNNKAYSVKNPAVSADGNTLYFASNMPGGYGNFDIYKASIRENGAIGAPQNLGKNINTKGQEMFPFISSTNTLYFSSDGHLGLGGMDVFYTLNNSKNTTSIINIGTPLNSNADDFAFSINDVSGEGFVSSNRPGGNGSDDIYSFKKTPDKCSAITMVIVLDKNTKQPLQNASLTLLDANGFQLTSEETNTKGVAKFSIECENKMTLNVSKDNYESTKVIVIKSSEKELNISIPLSPLRDLISENKVLLNPIYFEFDKYNITAKAAFELDKLVEIMIKYPSIIIAVTSHTDVRGSKTYNLKLSDSRAKSTVQYVISKGINKKRISGNGKGEEKPKIDCGLNCTDIEHQTNRRSEFIILNGAPNTN